MERDVEREQATSGPLAGCTVAVTRQEAGELGRLVAAAGGTVLHVPLIEITDPDDGGAELEQALRALDDVDWLVVTSPAGAERIGAAVAEHDVRLATVGTSTAARLAELSRRPVDLVPDVQLGAELARRFVESQSGRQRVLLALGDRAATTIHDALAGAGHEVRTVTAYRTALRAPDDDEIRRLAQADAVVFTSGSAAESWCDALGERAEEALPPLVVSIGPTTTAAAERRGLKISATAADHSLAGVVDELVRRWRNER